MELNDRVIAIVGSARTVIVQDKEIAARKACSELGQELAKAGWKIAVYSSDKNFIEVDVVTGYIASGEAKEKSIICYYPYGADVHFSEMDSHQDKDYFVAEVDPSENWEVSFYRCLTRVDAILLLGGGASTGTAAQIALSRNLPLLSVAPFGGAATEIWKNLRSQNLQYLEDSDIQAMATWTNNSAKKDIDSLNKQYERTKEKLSLAEQHNQALREKAANWEKHLIAVHEEKKKSFLAITFLVIFIIFLLAGLVSKPPLFLYTIITFLGLAAAGGVGSTIRMISSKPPKSRRNIVPILGIIVGLVFSILYLLPQLFQGESFLLPDIEITKGIRVQYISAMIVAFIAGLGFDYAIEQLLKKSQADTEQIVNKRE
jgi:hypothetical protein